MSNEMLTVNQIEEKYDNLQKFGIGLGITVALHLYGSINLKTIAKLIGKPENTSLRHIKKLVEEEYIVIDAQATATGRGKYYKLSELSKKIFTHINEKYDSEATRLEIKKKKEMSLDELMITTAKKLREEKYKEATTWLGMISNINSFVEKLTFQRIGDLIEELSTAEEDDEKLLTIMKKSNFFLGSIDLSTITLPITNKEQLFQIFEMFYNFTIELQRLKRQFIEENQKDDNKNIEVINQYIYTFLAPVNRDVLQSED